MPDNDEARLVILHPEKKHRAKSTDSDALKDAEEILKARGGGARSYKNMLLFLALDVEEGLGLEYETRRFLAWQSIVTDANALNLDAHQQKEASQGVKQSDESMNARLSNGYCWLLVPAEEVQERAGESVASHALQWEVKRISDGTEHPAIRASKKAKGEEHLIVSWSPKLLRMEIDRWFWKNAPHESLKRLWECCATYLYMPRLRERDVLLNAIKEGIRHREFFGYACGIGADGSYQGIQLEESSPSITYDAQSLIVRPETIQTQREEEARKRIPVSVPIGGGTPSTAQPSTAGGSSSGGSLPGTSPGDTPPPVPPTPPKLVKRFHGTIVLNTLKIGTHAGKIGEEVVSHLNSPMNSDVEVTLEISARVTGGFSDQVIHIVTENCRTLKFNDFGFEEE